MKKKFSILSIIIIAFIGAILIYTQFDEPEEKIIKNFKDEYTLVSEKNIFKYSDINEIINIIENETGVIYFSFPDCPWCQYYAKYLNEYAMQSDIDTIYYYNIKYDREINSVKYQKLVTLLNDNLFNDESGNKRIYVPSIVFVQDGKVIYYKNVNLAGEPSEYFDNDDDKNNLKLELTEYFGKINIENN